MLLALSCCLLQLSRYNLVENRLSYSVFLRASYNGEQEGAFRMAAKDSTETKVCDVEEVDTGSIEGDAYEPPFELSHTIINLCAEICEEIGTLNMPAQTYLSPRLRREHYIKTIHATLAIEQNTLSLDQVMAIIEGKRVLGHPREIKEVQNAIDAYELLRSVDVLELGDLLLVHKAMMQELIPDAGTLRKRGVGIMAGDQLLHIAPPASIVKSQLMALFAWYKNTRLHPLIKSSIFHYEFEFIHPFADGNGRVGRFWQSAQLSAWRELFYYLPLEELIREHQQAYYEALREADRRGSSTPFVEFLLELILSSCRQFYIPDSALSFAKDGPKQNRRIALLLRVMGDATLGATELMARLELSHKPSFRANYLLPALEAGLIEMTIPDKPQSPKQKYRRVLV